MRVALVHDWLTTMRGGERVLAEIAALFPQAPIYTLLHRHGTLEGELARHEIRTSFLQKLSFGGRFWRPLLPLMPNAIAQFHLGDFDLIISSSHCVAKGVIPPPGAVHVCYCHTPMRYLWDQREEYLSRVNALARHLVRSQSEKLRIWDVVSAARVDHFVANSHLVASRIERYWRRRAEVVPPPVDTALFTPGGAHGSYVLMVAALVPYKRVDVGIQVAKALGMPLHVVGEGPMKRRLQRQATADVSFKERLSVEALRDEYRGAAFLLVPNVEDFGMVSVEALACGTPVVGLACSGSADIVVSPQHGELATTGDVSELVAASRAVLGRSFNVSTLRQRAENFSRQRFQRRFGHLLERALPAVTSP